jgi:arginine decarboxylase
VWDVPKRIALVAADADGPFELVAFDNALRKAGIAGLNLVTVSSILPAKCRIVRLPVIEAGTISPVVIAKLCSSVPGQQIAVALGIATSEESHGMISEYHGVGVSQKHAARSAEAMVEYMMGKRGLTPKRVASISAGHTVEDHGAALACVVLLR